MNFIAATINESIDAVKDLQELNEVKPNEILELLEGLMPEILNFGINVLIAVIVFFLGRKGIKLVLKLISRSFRHSEIDESVVNFIKSIVNVILYIVLILVIIDRFGIKTTSLITLLGSAGLAIGLALQGSLSNFAGGVLILILKPFRVGDYIIEDNKKNEGVVVAIDLFYTRLLTEDDKSIIIPNGSLANTSLTNVTGQNKRRLDIMVTIGYKDDLKRIKESLRKILMDEKRTLKQEEIIVYVNSLEESTVTIGCRVWVHAGDYLDTKWDLTEQIKGIIEENKI